MLFVRGRLERRTVQRGFTLVELTIVIVLMAILAAVAAPRFFARGAVEGPAFAHELASAARYAQKLALAGGCPVRLVVESTGYRLLQPQAAPAPACDTVFTRAVLHPGTGEAFAGQVPVGVTVGGALPLTIEFNARGAAAAAGVSGTITIPVGDQTVLIAAGSGYVRVQ